MHYWISSQLAILAVFLLCCSTSGSHDPLLEEAYAYHQEAVVVHDSVVSMLDVLNKRVADMSQSDSTAMEYQKALAEIQQDFDQWDKALVSVPGYEEEHHHGHDHDHDHEHHHNENDLKGLASDQVLELQKDLKKEITRIHDSLDALMAKMN